MRKFKGVHRMSLIGIMFLLFSQVSIAQIENQDSLPKLKAYQEHDFSNGIRIVYFQPIATVYFLDGVKLEKSPREQVCNINSVKVLVIEHFNLSARFASEYHLWATSPNRHGFFKEGSIIENPITYANAVFPNFRNADKTYELNSDDY